MLFGALGMLLLSPLPVTQTRADQLETARTVQLTPVGADMTADEYRDAYRQNQKQLRNFVRDYSENSLLALRVPRRGVQLMGAVAGFAVTQNATLYLNDRKSFAINIKDTSQDDRAIYFGYKRSW